MNEFKNSNTSGRIQMELLNEKYNPLLSIGTSDGVVKIWNNLIDGNSVRLSTCFNALPTEDFQKIPFRNSRF